MKAVEKSEITRIDLAHVDNFAVGILDVSPSHRIVRTDAKERIIEPRIMQVLVALAAAGGSVVSRNDLIMSCWDGRVVGDNAIHRAVSRVRELAATIGEGSFSVETVKAVGYRLVVHQGASVADRSTMFEMSHKVGRRNAMIAVAIAMGGGVTSAIWKYGQSSARSESFRQGEVARLDEEALVGGMQAVASYKQALAAEPDRETYWAALALAYCQLLNQSQDEKIPGLTGLARSAAQRTLAINGRNIDGRAVLAIIRTPFRRWAASEAEIAPLASSGSADWQVNSYASRLAADMGQFGKAAAQIGNALRKQPLLPRALTDRFFLLWTQGNLHEAGDTLAEVGKGWPRNYHAWASRFLFEASQGNWVAARAVVAAEDDSPLNLSPGARDKRLLVLKALETGDATMRTSATMSLTEDLRSGRRAVPLATLTLALLDAEKEVEEALRGYLFAEGRFAYQLRDYSRRPTMFLYFPLLDRYRGKPWFVEITSRLGLPAMPSF